MAGLLSNKRCLIVGGTSGIGLAAARRFLDEGAVVVLSGLDQPTESAIFDSLLESGNCYAGTWDARDSKQVQEMFRTAVEMLGGLDVLYHVAGISGRAQGDGPLHECTDVGWQATIDANLKGMFLTNRAAEPLFLGQRQPR